MKKITLMQKKKLRIFNPKLKEKNQLLKEFKKFIGFNKSLIEIG